ncbi:MAG: hypothetical protein ABFD44_13960 [Anaerolineaceae bacterium]
MSRLTVRIGFWAAAAQSVVSLVYIIGLVILVGAALSQQSAAELSAQEWSNITAYAQHYADNRLSLTVGLIVQISAFLAGLLIPVIFLVLHEIADPAVRILTRIASMFTVMMAVVSSWGYYIQISSVHQIITRGGDLEGLGQFVEANVSSPGMATLQLGWALFYGLATLIIAPVFNRTRSERWIRAVFLINGIVGVAVGTAYAFGQTLLLPLAILGLIAASIAYPLLALRFHKAAREDASG